MAMSRKRREKITNTIVVAMGVSAWALVVETLITLVDQKALPAKDAKKLMQRAVAMLQDTPELRDHPAVIVAIASLTDFLDGWPMKKTKPG